MSLNRRSPSAVSILEAVLRALQDPAINALVGDAVSQEERDLMKYVSLYVRAATEAPMETFIYNLPFSLQNVFFNNAVLPDFCRVMLDRKLMLKQFLEDRVRHHDVKQLLVLGAGCCVRAMMLAKMFSNIKVFEVDYGVSRACKINAYDAYDQSKIAKDNFVSIDCDFRGRSLAVKLNANGFDSDKKTLVLAEGLFMYLEQNSVEIAFSKLKEMLGEGSEFVASFLPFIPKGKMLNYLLSFSGEPLKFSMQPKDVSVLAMRHDFAVTACSHHQVEADKVQEMYYVFEKRKPHTLNLQTLPDITALPLIPPSPLSPTPNPLYEVRANERRMI